MKKRILLFTLFAGLGGISLSSYISGPATFGYNCTGAVGSTTSCGNQGNNCHGGTSSATSVTIELDSAGVAVTHYIPGNTYTVKITGHNTSSLPRFGYQYAVVSGTGTSQIQAGTNSTPANSQITPFTGGLQIVEHSNSIAGVSGTYTVPSFTWTAPSAGVGTVTMYCTINAVDGNGLQDGTDVSNNNSLVLTELHVGVAELSKDIEISTYPNPASNQFTIKMGNATGIYAVNAFDVSGHKVYSSAVNTGGSPTQTVINCSNWPKGYYAIQVTQDGAQRILPFVKL